MATDGRKSYSITLDNSELRRGAQESVNIIHGIGQSAQKEGDAIDSSFRKIGQAAAGIFAASQIKDFVTQVANVRGEFQKLEIAFKTMLGSASQADALMGQLIETAATTPFGMSDIANSAKQLLAYGLEADKVNETLIRLGDIAAGLSIPINDLAYLYGTTMVQGRMYTQDLNQFLGRGIPIMDELAAQFGVAKDKVKDLVTEGKVGFPEVEKAIISLTSQGSKFGGLMEAQSSTITGQISNIEDSIEQMFNELGKRSEGVINDTLDLVSTIVDNWEAIGKTLLAVISTYGAYKAAVLAVAAAHKVAAIWGEVQAFLSLTKSVTSAKDAMLLLNMATKANPLGLVLSVVAAAATAFALFSDKTKTAGDEIAELREKIEEQEKALKDLEKQENVMTDVDTKVAQSTAEKINKIDLLRKRIEDETLSITNRRKAITALQALVPKYKASIDEEGRLHVKNANAIDEEIAAMTRLAYAKAMQSKREELVAKQLDADLRRSDARSQQATETANISAAASKIEAEQRKAQQANERARYSRGGNALSGFTESQMGDVFAGSMNGQAVQRAQNEKTASELRLKVAENDEKIAQKEYDAAKKGIDALDAYAKANKINLTASTSGSTTGGLTDKEKQKLANESAARGEKIAEYAEKEKQQSVQAQLDIRQATINAMEDGTDKELKQVRLNYDRLMAENDKRRTEMIEALRDKKTLEWQQQNPQATKEQIINYGSSLKLTDADLSAEQQATLKAYADFADETFAKAMDEISRKTTMTELTAMRDYLKEYGSFQEQKLAIASDYAEKIREVQQSSDSEETKAWKIKNLQAQQETEEGNVEAKAISAKIDWYTVFGNVGGILKEAMKPVLEELKTYVGKDKFQKLGADQQKQIVDAMNTIREQIGTNGDLGWQDLARDLTAYQDALQAASKETSDYAKLQEKFAPQIKAVQKKISEAVASGDTKATDAAQTELTSIMKELAEGGERVNKANGKVTSSGRKLAQTAQDVTQPIDEIHNFLQDTGLSDLQAVWDSLLKIKGAADGLKALSEAADGAKDVGDAIQDAGDSIKDAGKAVGDTLSKGGFIAQIIGAILKILDVLKDGIGPVVSSIIDSILNAVSGIIDNILSGDLFAQIGTSLYKGVTNILNSIIGNLAHLITGGSVSADMQDWFNSSNAKAVMKTTEELTNRNELLQNSIEKLTESIDNAYGTSSLKSYEEAKKAQEERTANLQTILNAQQRYHSAHKSNAHYWNVSDEYTDLVNDLLGTNLTGNDWNGWGQLTPEQMDKIRASLPQVWTSMLDQGKYDKSEYFENYADEAGKLEELTEKINENLTTTTFENLRDDFISNLMDMEMSAEDFSNNFSKMMQEALLQATVSNKFDTKLQNWYKRLAAAMQKADGTYRELTKDEIESFRSEYNSFIEEGLAERDRLLQITGYTGDSDSTRDASEKGIATASQESVDELNGRATAIQSHTYSINEQTKLLVSNTNAILNSVLNIEGHTETISERLTNVETYVKGMRDTVNDISLKGVKVK